MAFIFALNLKSDRFSGRSAFTLVELTVALVIIAALAHLAVREVSHLRDAKLADVADRQLEELRDSVYCRAPGEQSTGFLADMGRLPRAESSERASLDELWKIPADASPFAVREAVSSNLCVSASEKPLLAGAGVWVPTGWRGPYLRIPVGRNELLDPWGNPIANPDAAGYSRLGVTNGCIVSTSHFGPTAQPKDPRTRTLSLAPAGATKCTLTVNMTASESAGTISLKWFGPSSGMITGAVESVTAPGTARFEGLTPGVRVLWDSATKAPRFIEIKPGDNICQLNLP